MAQLILLFVMNLPNQYFQDYPIEFKEVNPRDFTSVLGRDKNKIKNEGFQIENNGKKLVIEVKKYLSDVLPKYIDLQRKNTVVINASVGQGKSYAIIQILKEYWKEKDKYLIVVASPFVSLVKQYCKDIHKDAGVPKNEIYNYNSLGRETNITYVDKPIQVLTVNTLLGNPGDDGFKNSDIKREYLNNLIEHCKRTNKKVVFIYDEIHDSYHNFKEKYIFNLWKWHEVIHKNFILSATYNEASKVVIEYLAELTDRRIKIIESKRERYLERLSKLHLHISPAYRFSNSTPEIVSVINNTISRGKSIDILCYSKNLAKSLLDKKEGVGKLLNKTFVEVKDCTSELVAGQRAENDEPKNQFEDSDLTCNVGTNFKTGVSITKENHAFIIIMPPRATKLWFRNKYGIFSGGINSVIQALARQRLPEEIHIVLPEPDQFDYSSLNNAKMNIEQKEEFKKWYKQVEYYRKPDTTIKYYPLNIQDMLLRSFYEEQLKGFVEAEIEHVKNIDRSNLGRLSFPDFANFKLEDGEDYLANTVPIYGEDIASYVVYAAFTNQFVNCNLVELNYKPTVLFKEGELQKTFLKFFKQYLGNDYYHSLVVESNFALVYHDFRSNLFNSFNVKYKKASEKEYSNLLPYSEKKFELQMLNFVSKLYYKRNIGNDLLDKEYTRGDYFNDCISSIDLATTHLTTLAKFYQILNSIKMKVGSGIQHANQNGHNYLWLKRTMPDGFFNVEELEQINEMKSLIKEDALLDNDVFDFKRTFKPTSLYKMIIEDFYVSIEDRHPPQVDRRRTHIRKIISSRINPISNKINLVTPPDYFDRL